MERLEQIKSYTTVHKDKDGDRYLIQKEDLHWLIGQVEKVKELHLKYQNLLNSINNAVEENNKR